jgi:hypothetical protein
MASQANQTLPSYRSPRSDVWIQRELSIASQNAKKNRFIKADPKTLEVKEKVSELNISAADSTSTPRTNDPIVIKLESYFHQIRRSSNAAEVNMGLQPKIQEMFDDWSNSLKSAIFPKEEAFWTKSISSSKILIFERR